jgi:transcriptional regulator with XRE-family HTH domain
MSTAQAPVAVIQPVVAIAALYRLSQTRFAKDNGLSRSLVNRVWLGLQPPSVAFAAAAAKYFGVSEDQLFTPQRAPEPSPHVNPRGRNGGRQRRRKAGRR